MWYSEYGTGTGEGIVVSGDVAEYGGGDTTFVMASDACAPSLQDCVVAAATAHSGSIVQPYSGGFLVRFSRALDALRFALTFESSLEQERVPDNSQLRCRLGVHIDAGHGPAERSGDVEGSVASLLRNHVAPGVIALSGPVIERLDDIPNLEIREFGEALRPGSPETTGAYAIPLATLRARALAVISPRSEPRPQPNPGVPGSLAAPSRARTPRRTLAKLTPPNSRNLLKRERVYRQFDALLAECRAVWIAAPAGFGKTTLAAAYLEDRDFTVLWYQVDGRDNDVATWFHYLSRAPAITNAEGTNLQLPVPRPDQLGQPELFARTFFDEYSLTLDEGTVLVFDNLNDVDDEAPLHACMLALLDSLPPDIYVVIVSRHYPHEPYMRLIANQRMKVVDQRMLEFSGDESRALLALRGHPPSFITSSQAWLNGYGGWAAGLVMLSEWARLSGRDDAVIVGPENAAIFDYFSAEIRARLSDGAVSKLAKCAVLPMVKPELAVRLVGSADVVGLLEELNRRNSFTTAHFGDELYYQFHPLFREFLRRDFDTLPPSERDEVLVLAGQLLAQDGQIEAAVGLFRDTCSWDALSDLILGEAPALVRQGRVSLLREWLEGLPDHCFAARPWLSFWLGTALTFVDLDAARTTLEQALDRFRRTGDVIGVYRTMSAIFRTIIFLWSRSEALIEWTERLETIRLEFPEFPDRSVEADFFTGLMSCVHWDLATHPRIYEWCRQMLEAGLEQPDRDIRASAIARAAFFWATNGKLEDARQLWPALKDSIGLAFGNIFARHSTIYVCNLFEYFFGDLQSAVAGYRELIRVDEQVDLKAWAPINLAWSGYTEFCAGNIDEVRRRADSLARIVDSYGPFIRHFRHELNVLLATISGELDAALSEAEAALQAARTSGGPYMECWALTGVAMARSNLGRDAAPALAEAGALAAKINSELLTAMVVIVDAATAVRAGGPEDVVEARLRIALATYAKQGVKRTHWPTASIVVATAALERDIEPSIARAMLDANTGGQPGDVDSRGELWPWKIRVYLFGDIRVYRDGAPLSFGRKAPRRPLELLAALVLAGGERVPQTRLIDQLWPDEDGDAARSAFTSTMSRLRKLVGADMITVQDGRVSLDRERCWADVWAVERVFAGASSADDRARALGWAAQGLLAGEDDKPWLLPYQQHCRDRHVSLALEVAAVAAGSEAIDVLERALAIAPFHEALCRELVERYLEVDRPADAAQCMDAFERRLRLQAGREMGREMHALREVVRTSLGETSNR